MTSCCEHGENDCKLQPIQSPEGNRSIYFFLGRCESAEPAAVFAALLAFGSRSTLEAADAALLPVTTRFDFRAIHIPLSGLAQHQVLRYFLPRNTIWGTDTSLSTPIEWKPSLPSIKPCLGRPGRDSIKERTSAQRFDSHYLPIVCQAGRISVPRNETLASEFEVRAITTVGPVAEAFDGVEDVVHLKGFGFRLCLSMKARMSASSCLVEAWTPRCSCLRISSANQRPT